MDLETEFELIQSALLPEETLQVDERDGGNKSFAIRSSSSTYRIEVTIREASGSAEPWAVFRVKGDLMGRDEANEWIQWAEDVTRANWEEASQTGCGV
jgi:hypothetical protein